jgi:hypothetical protein
LDSSFECVCPTGQGFYTPASTTDCLKCSVDNCKVCNGGVCTECYDDYLLAYIDSSNVNAGLMC